MPQDSLYYPHTVAFLEELRCRKVANGMKAKSLYSCLVTKTPHELESVCKGFSVMLSGKSIPVQAYKDIFRFNFPVFQPP